MLYEQNVAGTSYTDTNVFNGVTYYYEISAANGIGESNLSNEVTATPLPPLPSAPVSLTATARAVRKSACPGRDRRRPPAA